MRIDSNEFVSFCKICSQEQTINPVKAPIEDIYLNHIDSIPAKAQAAFGSKSPSEIKIGI